MKSVRFLTVDGNQIAVPVDKIDCIIFPANSTTTTHWIVINGQEYRVTESTATQIADYISRDEFLA